MRRALFASIGFLAATGIAAADTLEGRWSLYADGCNQEISDGILTVDLQEGTFNYWESECTITNVTPVGIAEVAWQVKFECSGEGDFWEYEAIYAIDTPVDGAGPTRLVELDLLGGYVVSRVRCAVPAEAK
jgi:hypothetical protein